jgi:DNA-binding PucR family transcriptional regulator
MSKILSLRDVVSQIDSGIDLETTLKYLILSACKHAGWAMGSIMAIDAKAGFGQVMVRHDPTLIAAELPDKWELGSSPSLVALKRNEPVYIRDVRLAEEFPGYVRDAQARDYRTVLVMPMNCKDAVGRPMVLSVISRKIKDVSQEELVFLGTIIHLGSIAVAREHRMKAQIRATERLNRALNAHTQLLDHVLTDGSVSSLTELVETLLHIPIIVVDFSDNQISVGRSPDRAIFSDAEWQRIVPTQFGRQIIQAVKGAVPQREAPSEPLRLVDAARRAEFTARIEPLFMDKELSGAVMVFAPNDDFSDLDLLLLDSARFALSVQIMRNHARFRSEAHVLSELFRALVEKRWRSESEICQRALHLGLNLRIPQQMIAIDFSGHALMQGGAIEDCKRILARIAPADAASATVVGHLDRIVCLLPVESALRGKRTEASVSALAAELGRNAEVTPIVVLGAICDDLDDYAAMWERCERLIGIGRTFGLQGVLKVSDSSPLEMMVSALGAHDVRDYVSKSIGPIARHDLEHGTDYLDTLAAYLRAGCRSQPCADALGLHVSTLRYRLARLNEIFGIEIDSPEKRFDLELAVRLQMIARTEATAR